MLQADQGEAESLPLQVLQPVQHLPDGPVADGVDGDGLAMGMGGRQHLPQRLVGVEEQARLAAEEG